MGASERYQDRSLRVSVTKALSTIDGEKFLLGKDILAGQNKDISMTKSCLGKQHFESPEAGYDKQNIFH
jgi:hypothetical protein